MPKDGGKRKKSEKTRDDARDKGRPSKSARTASAALPKEATVAGSMGAAAMGPVSARPELPQTREELIELWREARRRRQSAPPESEAYIQACEDVARIEVEIAAVERALTPPRV